MALSPNINDLEKGKFVEVDGQPNVRVSGSNFSGSFSQTGLSVGGLVTVVTINQTTWTALPSAGALANRNAISIQNESGQAVKINYSSGVAGFVGMTLNTGNERFYDITDGIILYAKSQTSSVTLNVEEIA